MKILLGVDERSPGSYVDHLIRGLVEEGLEVEWSVSRTLEPDASVDLVHVQWPEALCRWERPGRACVDGVRRALDGWRELGTPVVVTRHNALPHLHREAPAAELYHVVHQAATAVVHLGESGRPELEERYGGLHRVIPHGGYPDADLVDRGWARAELGIAPDAFTVLVFGAVRTFGEQRLILETARRLGVSGARWIVPRWREATRPSWAREPVERIRSVFTDLAAARTLRIDDGLVPEARIPVFFGATDVVFVPRIRALNSGVPPLAYSFATPVVGPDLGNVGPMLEETDNFTYEAGDPDDAARALGEARNADLEETGRLNRRIAETRWSWETVARRHVELYRRVLEGPGPSSSGPG